MTDHVSWELVAQSRNTCTYLNRYRACPSPPKLCQFWSFQSFFRAIVTSNTKHARRRGDDARSKRRSFHVVLSQKNLNCLDLVKSVVSHGQARALHLQSMTESTTTFLPRMVQGTGSPAVAPFWATGITVYVFRS